MLACQCKSHFYFLVVDLIRWILHSRLHVDQIGLKWSHSHCPQGTHCLGQVASRSMFSTKRNVTNVLNPSIFSSLLFNIVILLLEEILHHLGCIKPCKQWDELPINWCGISSINSKTATAVLEWPNTSVLGKSGNLGERNQPAIKAVWSCAYHECNDWPIASSFQEVDEGDDCDCIHNVHNMYMYASSQKDQKDSASIPVANYDVFGDGCAHVGLSLVILTNHPTILWQFGQGFLTLRKTKVQTVSPIKSLIA